MEIAFVPIAAVPPARLLAFETANRAYFESMIDPRDPSFYCLEGVARHIDALHTDAQQRRGASFALTGPDGELVGRANLKAIDAAAASAEIGYRIGQTYTGRGIATRAVIFLLDEARARGLRSVDAVVLDSNAASAKVLAKCGFVAGPADGEMLTARGREGTRRYRFLLD